MIESVEREARVRGSSGSAGDAPDPEAAASNRSAKQVRIAFCVVVLIFGVCTAGLVNGQMNAKIAGVTIAVFFVPLLLQLSHSAMIRVYAVWLGVMLLGQSIATPWFENDEFFTLPPNMNYRVDIVERVAQGIVGIQNVSTDRMGFRTNPPVDYQNKAALRIVAIGGSTTEEILLDDRATWTHQKVYPVVPGSSGMRLVVAT